MPNARPTCKRATFWIGILSICLSLTSFTLGHTAYVQRRQPDHFPLAATILDCAGLIGLVAGCGLILISSFLPLRRRFR